VPGGQFFWGGILPKCNGEVYKVGLDRMETGLDV